VTGSVNQRGEVQAVGGVNEKVEGSFDLCQARGLTGEQGALIPASNVQHLMLRRDVVEAVEAGKFHVYPIETIDQGIEILTGIEAGIGTPWAGRHCLSPFQIGVCCNLRRGLNASCSSLIIHCAEWT
jgi:hypothetical protein